MLPIIFFPFNVKKLLWFFNEGQDKSAFAEFVMQTCHVLMDITIDPDPQLFGRQLVKNQVYNFRAPLLINSKWTLSWRKYKQKLCNRSSFEQPL